MKRESQASGGPPEKRTECVGSCMVCDPKCGVHRVRAENRARRKAAAHPSTVRLLAGNKGRRGI